MAYEGKYFTDRDFYDWGLDYEFQRLTEYFDKNIDTLKMYRKSYKMIVDGKRAELEDLNKDEQRIVSIYVANASARDINAINKEKRDLPELISDYPWIENVVVLEGKLGDAVQHDLYIIISMYMIEEEELHNSMCFINLYTIIDEYFSEVARAIAVYYERFIKSVKIRTSYDELHDISNDIDLRDYIIQTALLEDKSFSGATEKFSKIVKFFSKTQDDLRSRIILYQIERNSIIHNISIYKENDMNKIQDNLKKKYGIEAGKVVRISNKRLDDVIVLADEISSTFLSMCSEYFD